MQIYSVDEAARRLGLSKQTLLRYEKKGIFPRASRNRINHWREYTDEDIQRMRRILGRGFTMIELVMVIVIVGILAALAMPRFESFNFIKLEGAVNKAVSDLRYVQQLAVSRHDTYAVSFDPAGETYRAFRVSDNSAIQDPFSRRYLDPWVDFTADPKYGGIDIFSADFGGSPILTFDWEGVPSSGGSVQLRYRGASRIISIEPNTARVTVQ